MCSKICQIWLIDNFAKLPLRTRFAVHMPPALADRRTSSFQNIRCAIKDRTNAVCEMGVIRHGYSVVALSAGERILVCTAAAGAALQRHPGPLATLELWQTPCTDFVQNH